MDLFREKHTLQTECGPSQKVRKAPGYGVVSFYSTGSFHGLMSGGSIPVILGRGGDFQELGHRPFFDPYDRSWNCHGACGCVI